MKIKYATPKHLSPKGQKALDSLLNEIVKRHDQGVEDFQDLTVDFEIDDAITHCQENSTILKLCIHALSSLQNKIDEDINSLKFYKKNTVVALKS